MPALYSIVFVLLLVVHQRWHCHSVEIIEIAIAGVVDLTWLDRFRVRCKRCRQEKREEGDGEGMAHDGFGAGAAPISADQIWLVFIAI